MADRKKIEEVAKEVYPSEIVTKRRSDFTNGALHFQKEEAIAFAEWLAKNRYRSYRSDLEGKCFWVDLNQEDVNHLTTDQLYQKFTEEK
jgi:hypothetical protein